MVTSQNKVVRYATWEVHDGVGVYHGSDYNSVVMCEDCSGEQPVEKYLQIYGNWLFVCDECALKYIW